MVIAAILLWAFVASCLAIYEWRLARKSIRDLRVEVRENSDLRYAHERNLEYIEELKRRVNELEPECQRLDGINRELEAEIKRLRERNKNFENGTAWEAFRQQSIASKRYAREVEVELNMARCEILALQARLSSEPN